MNIPTDYRFIDLRGRRFTRLLVIDYAGRPKKAHKWVCVCDCGTHIEAFGSNLVKGHTQSCGCHRIDASKSRIKHGHYRNRTPTREYRSWANAKDRTSRKGNEAWKDYGGRGIKMCQRWADSFEAFLEDMGPCPPGYEIERIDNNGNYEPGNCKWINGSLQSSNRRNNVMLTLDGRTQTVRAWEKEMGLGNGYIHRRLQAGWSVKNAITHKPDGNKRPA